VIGKAIVEGFKFGFSLKRLVPVLLINFLFLYSTFFVLGKIGPMEITEEAVREVAPLLGLYLFILIFCFISQPILITVMLHQAKAKKVQIKKSFRFSFSLFPKTFVVYLLYIILILVLGFIPFLWPILLLLFFSSFFYVYPLIVLKDKDIIEAFKKSFEIFKKYPIQTFVLLILISLLSFVLITISFAPLALWLAASVFKDYQQGSNLSSIALQIADFFVSPIIIPFLLIPSLVSAYIFVVALGMISKFFLSLKKI